MDLLQKVEELTLYTLEQETRLDAQQRRIAELEAQQGRIAELEALLNQALSALD
ncbi:hypothetical protein D3C83_285340 [compost metagenome]